jgi:hypothetical protein
LAGNTGSGGQPEAAKKIWLFVFKKITLVENDRKFTNGDRIVFSLGAEKTH